jgi:sulfhydrogenase subunit beta (sulfur reductase)
MTAGGLFWILRSYILQMPEVRRRAPEEGLAMATQSIRAGEAVFLPRESLQGLIGALQRDRFQVVGPRARDGAIVFDIIDSASDLPFGFSTHQSPGRLRLEQQAGGGPFTYTNTAQGLKRFLHPSDVRITTLERAGSAFQILNDPPSVGRYAFLGVRACDLAAVQRLDRVLCYDRYPDTIYAAQRANALFIAVECRQCAETCFCKSVGTGPELTGGYDIGLIESGEGFRAMAGTAAGADLLSALEDAYPMNPAVEPVENKACRQKRSIDVEGLREDLYRNFDHPRWDDVAARCLACANCTMSCPTCFCMTVEDTSDVTQERAERWRRWDSCFTQNFTYIHGGSVRLSLKSRYRQWLTHKLAAWVDQFGELGCVGCGRCITWCPAGIDITEEVAALRG